MFICKEQTYYLKNENLLDFSLTDNSFSSFYSSTKRQFLSYFENSYIEITKPIESVVDPEKNSEIKKEVTDIYLPFISLTASGESNLNIGWFNNKILNELDINLNLFKNN